jgi:hypothetical protein
VTRCQGILKPRETLSLSFVEICAAATGCRSRTAALHQLHSRSSLREVCVALCLEPHALFYIVGATASAVGATASAFGVMAFAFCYASFALCSFRAKELGDNGSAKKELALCIFLGPSVVTKLFYSQEPLDTWIKEPETICTSRKGCVPQTHLIFPSPCFAVSPCLSSVVTRWQLQSVLDISVVDGAGSSHLLHRWTLGISPSLLFIDAGLLMLSVRQPHLLPIEATRVQPLPIEATRVLHQQLYIALLMCARRNIHARPPVSAPFWPCPFATLISECYLFSGHNNFRVSETPAA